MSYVRKTRDMWVVEGDYGWGFETVTISDNLEEAMQDLKDYRANLPHPYRIKKKRVKKHNG